MGRFAVFLLVYVLCGFPWKSHSQEAYNYDDEYYDDDDYKEEPTATVIPKWKVSGTVSKYKNVKRYAKTHYYHILSAYLISLLKS